MEEKFIKFATNDKLFKPITPPIITQIGPLKKKRGSVHLNKVQVRVDKTSVNTHRRIHPSFIPSYSGHVINQQKSTDKMVRGIKLEGKTRLQIFGSNPKLYSWLTSSSVHIPSSSLGHPIPSMCVMLVGIA